MIESAEDFRPGMRSEEPYLSNRLLFLRIHPLCRPCAAQGFTVGAAEIDHLVPVKEAPDRFLDRSNWQPYLPPMPRTEDGHGDPRGRFMTPEQAGWQERLMETASRGIAL